MFSVYPPVTVVSRLCFGSASGRHIQVAFRGFFF